jgi:hypothetical protein
MPQIPQPPLRGDESLAGLDATVLDFWRFAMPDVTRDDVRDHLAAYLVARAAGATHPRLDDDEHDVRTPDGRRIAVRSGGKVFAGLRTDGVDLFTFCVPTPDHDPLDTGAWTFHVLAAATVGGLAVDRLSLGRVRALVDPVPYAGLPRALR